MGAHEVAVALLKAHEEAVLLALGLELVDLVADVLEAGQHAAHLEAPVTGERVRHGRGDDGGDGNLAGDVLAVVLGHRGQPVHEQNAHLVAGEQHVVAVVRNGGAHAVRVRVGGDEQVRLHLVGELEAKLEGLAELGVGVLAGGEVAVRLGLLGHDGHVVDANLLEDAGHALHAGAVERRVDHGVVVASLEARHADLLDGSDEVVENLLGRPLDQALLETLVKVHDLDVERIGLGDVGRDLGSGLVRDLAAVVVVDLVAVVDGGVVRGREHDTGARVQVAHGKRQRGDRLDAGIDVDVDAVGGQHARSDLLEVLALEAGVTRKGERGVLVVRVEVIGYALGGLGNHIDVHAVGANAQHAAETGGAKRKVAIEGVAQLVLIARLDELLKLRGKIGLGNVGLPEIDDFLDVCVHVIPPRLRPSARGGRPAPGMAPPRRRAARSRTSHIVHSVARLTCGGGEARRQNGRRRREKTCGAKRPQDRRQRRGQSSRDLAQRVLRDLLALAHGANNPPLEVVLKQQSLDETPKLSRVSRGGGRAARRRLSI